MNLKKVLSDHQFPPSFYESFSLSGIENLYPTQAEAIQKGVLDGRHLLMSVPTASGKTLIAELAMAQAILTKGGRCLYIAPLKALASEKYKEFRKKFEHLGIEVALAIGDADSPVKRLKTFQILVATAEKVDSLLRTRSKGLIGSLTTVILDEVHFINDVNRGPTMEILIARIKQLNPKIQIVALSATVSNADEMAKWLGSELVVSSWRPIPLKEGVYYNDLIFFDHEASRMVKEDSNEDVGKLSLDTLRGGGQVLIFVNSRRSAQAVSRQISGDIAEVISPEERDRLKVLSKKIVGSEADATKICKTLGGVIQNGIAFHHAGLKPHQRELIEENFKSNLIKVISCTPTLAAGVNLPARRAIIRDCKRYESGIGMAYIPTSEYKQCAGRAGRPQYDTYGEAVLIAKTPNEASTLFERYIRATPEPITSKLGSEAALRIHVLSSVAGGYVHDVGGMFDFIKHTFFYHQHQSDAILDLIADIFEFLNREKFVEKSGTRYFATPFGSLTSRLYIDPMTSITLRDALNKLKGEAPLSAIGMLHVCTCAPDATLLHVGKSDTETLERFLANHENQFILTPETYPALDNYFDYLSTVKTTYMLSQWIDEEKEESICDQFGVGPGDIYRHIESIQWLLYAATTIAEYLQKKRITFALEHVRDRVRYGIKEELLELAQLKGVGRVRARQLFKKGFKKFTDFRFSTVEDIAGIPQIGKTLAADILKQTQSTESRTVN